MPQSWVGGHVITLTNVSVGVIARSLSSEHVENELASDTREKVFYVTLKNTRKVRGKTLCIIELVQSKGIMGFEKTISFQRSGQRDHDGC